MPYLTIITFLPLVGAIAIALLLKRDDARGIKWVAAGFSLVTFLLSLVLVFLFKTNDPMLQAQFVERANWISVGQFKVEYFLGVDGLSLPMVILTTLLGFLAVLISWKISLRPKEYFSLLLVLETGVLGVFTSLDFFLFFLFWEVELVPMFLLIGIWGSGRREYSAMKFLIYTIVGSAFMLAGILWLYFASSPNTFDMIALGQGSVKEGANLIFLLLFIGFAIKLPMVPFHTWLPDAHSDAPTAVSVMLAGVLLKMGGYGIIRICVTILPDAAKYFAPALLILAVIGVLYGAAVTMVQKDLKRLIAYSSVSHMGYVLLGVAALTKIGLVGAVLQMFTHGTITGLLFMVVGLIYDRTHTRQIPELTGGLAQRMPVIAAVFTVAGLASLGLPALSGFVAELLVFIGVYEKYQLAAILGASGIVLTAGYILWMLQRVFFGEFNPKWSDLTDAVTVERVAVFTMVVVIVLVGVAPAVVLNMVNTAVPTIMARLGS
ncbi:MAG: NADH-quinone oxidoreductase subunit M [Chloroflexi bacterium]|nr:NADH-quinone oxidoreductase subunit M [Chloroflexota bacterium]